MSMDQPAVPPPPGAAGPRSDRTNGMAVASLVLGIVGILLTLFGILPLLAIIFGVIARRQIANGQGRGSGMATAGIVLGIIGIVLVIIIIIAVGANPTLFQRNS